MLCSTLNIEHYLCNNLLHLASVALKTEIFGNFPDSISTFLRRLCLAHPIKYFDVDSHRLLYATTLERRLADSVSLFHTEFELNN